MFLAIEGGLVNLPMSFVFKGARLQPKFCIPRLFEWSHVLETPSPGSVTFSVPIAGYISLRQQLFKKEFCFDLMQVT
jgi:hypothetical protein